MEVTLSILIPVYQSGHTLTLITAAYFFMLHLHSDIKYMNTGLYNNCDIFKRAHMATGHGGPDRMQKQLQKKYANITKNALELYKSFCEECQKKRKRPMTKGVVLRPILKRIFIKRSG